MEDLYLKYKSSLQNTELFAHLNEAAKDKYIWQQISRGKEIKKEIHRSVVAETSSFRAGRSNVTIFDHMNIISLHYMNT